MVLAHTFSKKTVTSVTMITTIFLKLYSLHMQFKLNVPRR